MVNGIIKALQQRHSQKTIRMSQQQPNTELNKIDVDSCSQNRHVTQQSSINTSIKDALLIKVTE